MGQITTTALQLHQGEHKKPPLFYTISSMMNYESQWTQAQRDVYARLYFEPLLLQFCKVLMKLLEITHKRGVLKEVSKLNMPQSQKDFIEENFNDIVAVLS